jgi:hypothetical protein
MEVEIHEAEQREVVQLVSRLRVYVSLLIRHEYCGLIAILTAAVGEPITWPTARLEPFFVESRSYAKLEPLARIIHDSSSRKRADVKRDGHSEAGDWLRHLRRCLSRCSSDWDWCQKEGRQSPTICRRAERRNSPSQLRIRACSSSAHE